MSDLLQPSSTVGPKVAIPVVRPLRPGEEAQVVSLRVAEYGDSGTLMESELHELRWNEWDANGLVLVVAEAGQIAATMRCNAIGDLATLRGQLRCTDLPWKPSFPSLSLARAATASSAHGKGFNSLIRYHLFAAAMRLGWPSVVGRVLDGAPRTRLMRELGYQLKTTPRTSREHSAYMTAYLDLVSQGESACEQLRARSTVDTSFTDEVADHLANLPLLTQWFAAD